MRKKEDFTFSFKDWETALDQPHLDDGRMDETCCKVVKSKEEIQLLCVDETLNEIERALFLLKYL